MYIYDNDNNLLAIVIKNGTSTKDKDFHTDHSSELQIASFNLKKDELIERHYHENEEKIFSTNEVIIIQSGKMTLTLYDLDFNKIEDVILESGDMVALFNGGHEIKIEEQTKFIEVKQGPYSEEKDKTRF